MPNETIQGWEQNVHYLTLSFQQEQIACLYIFKWLVLIGYCLYLVIQRKSIDQKNNKPAAIGLKLFWGFFIVEIIYVLLAYGLVLESLFSPKVLLSVILARLLVLGLGVFFLSGLTYALKFCIWKSKYQKRSIGKQLILGLQFVFIFLSICAATLILGSVERYSSQIFKSGYAEGAFPDNDKRALIQNFLQRNKIENIDLYLSENPDPNAKAFYGSSITINSGYMNLADGPFMTAVYHECFHVIHLSEQFIFIGALGVCLLITFVMFICLYRKRKKLSARLTNNRLMRGRQLIELPRAAFLLVLLWVPMQVISLSLSRYHEEACDLYAIEQIEANNLKNSDREEVFKLWLKEYPRLNPDPPLLHLILFETHPSVKERIMQTK